MYIIETERGAYRMHHGVKGMKWGVRKADYNAPGMRSRDILERIDSLDTQESRAHAGNRSNYRQAKRQVKSEAKEKVKAAKAANKEARKEYNKSFNKAWGFQQVHPITSMIKKSKNYDKNQENWEDAIKKADAYNAAHKNMRYAKKAYKSDVKTGKAAAKEVFRKNSDAITKDFDKAYYKTIGASYIKSARNTNSGIELAMILTDKAIGIDHDSSRYKDVRDQLDYAEERRNRYINRKR